LVTKFRIHDVVTPRHPDVTTISGSKRSNVTVEEHVWPVLRSAKNLFVCKFSAENLIPEGKMKDDAV